MNILNHVGAAIESSNALEDESDSVLAFFGASRGNERRVSAKWGPRNRRRARNRRAA